MSERTNPNPAVYVILPPELRAKLDARVKAERRKLAVIVETALEAYLSKPAAK
jgi:hypothetical protein